jgi:2-haloacid dehalogenase
MTSQLINTIIFDFGGVLLDWNPYNLYRQFFNNKAEIDKFLTEINFSDWNTEQDRGRAFAQGVAELSAKFPKYSHLISAYKENWEDSIVGPIEGSVAILQQLKEGGYSIYGLSNWSAETFPIAFNKYNFFKLFDDIIISGDVHILKPDPQIFELILARAGRSANECLLIDDSGPNITAAQRLGFLTIHFHSPEQLRIELKKLGVIGDTYMERNIK